MLLRAFAKINLGLKILGKREDGFHELRTVFQTIDWFDEIQIEPAASFDFQASQGPQDESNLVVRAVRACERATGTSVNVRIRLQKNVPAGAGLGGGSADAAATLTGLQRLYGVKFDGSVWRSLGSDVPFFSVGGRAIGTGRGDEIEPLEDEDSYSLVLVNPGFTISTAEAYSWLTLTDKTNSIEGFCSQFVPDREYPELTNDFEMPVFGRYPQLREIRDELVRRGAFRAALSGSGSVIFGQFRIERNARQAADLLSRRWAVRAAKPLSRSQYFLRMVE